MPEVYPLAVEVRDDRHAAPERGGAAHITTDVGVDVHHIRVANVLDGPAYAAKATYCGDIDDDGGRARRDEPRLQCSVRAQRDHAHVEPIAVRVLDVLHHDGCSPAEREIRQQVEHSDDGHGLKVPVLPRARDPEGGDPAYAD